MGESVAACDRLLVWKLPARGGVKRAKISRESARFSASTGNAVERGENDAVRSGVPLKMVPGFIVVTRLEPVMHDADTVDRNIRSLVHFHALTSAKIMATDGHLRPLSSPKTPRDREPTRAKSHALDSCCSTVTANIALLIERSNAWKVGVIACDEFSKLWRCLRSFVCTVEFELGRYSAMKFIFCCNRL